MPKTMEEQVKWSVSFDSAKMEKEEEPIKYLGRIDKDCWGARVARCSENGSRR